MQEFIIFLVFVVALGYLGSRAYRRFFAKKSAGCGKGCGCSPAAEHPVTATEK